MFAIDDPNLGAASSPPAIPAAVTGGGYFTNGNPAAGEAATDVPDWWLNMTQAEMLAILEAAGVTPDKTNNAQVLAALQILFGSRSAISFTQSTAWSCPAGVTKVRIRLWSAGGGGGGCSGSESGGAAAGGGGYTEGIYTVVPGTTYQITIGNGGTGGSGSVAGQAGGASSFGVLLSATGGMGGGYGVNSVFNSGGAGGIPSGGNVYTQSGSAGGTPGSVGSSVVIGSIGGGTFCTSSSLFSAGTTAQPGQSGAFPGGGASGGINGGPGGTGASGLCILEY